MSGSTRECAEAGFQRRSADPLARRQCSGQWGSRDCDGRRSGSRKRRRLAVASIARRPDGTYRPRYRDQNGKEHARHFKRKADAQRWLDEVTASVVTGSYVDPQAGRATFDAYYRAWSERQVWAPMTEVQMDLVRRKVTFGAVPMAALRASHLETWVKAMVSDGYAPNTVATRVNAVRAALKSAVRDRVIAIDPSAGLRLPARRRAEHAMESRHPTRSER